MFGIGKKTTEATASDLGVAQGRISLQKNQIISLTKTPKITVTVTWPDRTDYDVFALVLYTDGHVETVAQFGTERNPRDYRPSTTDGAVTHLGDIKRGTGRDIANESIDIALNPNIAAIVPVVYSAKSNGTGSFRRYQVGMSIDNGQGDIVTIDAHDASDNDHIYSCVPGIIRNTSAVQIQKLELYSKPNSELRPTIDRHGNVHMDTGPENARK
ncbi:TerD family protein [Curtobacterium sp. MCBD17_040]|uniref:TerD family protein n=1 Tax=Curtobacterium sp. MCBD17_040 TaxID=2175674 RepID=UPI0024DFD2B7|nr:TerD family protein [Curtobacterium sp. MCBD17_040]WIB65390.1 TerD family protein [Curtobacterium sp. MCBD17_040]